MHLDTLLNTSPPPLASSSSLSLLLSSVSLSSWLSSIELFGFPVFGTGAPAAGERWVLWLLGLLRRAKRVTKEDVFVTLETIAELAAAMLRTEVLRLARPHLLRAWSCACLVAAASITFGCFTLWRPVLGDAFVSTLLSSLSLRSAASSKG